MIGYFGAHQLQGYPACTCPCPTLRIRRYRRTHMARGQDGSLLLSCTTLSFITSRRFIPTLSRPKAYSTKLLSNTTLSVPTWKCKNYKDRLKPNVTYFGGQSSQRTALCADPEGVPDHRRRWSASRWMALCRQEQAKGLLHKAAYQYNVSVPSGQTKEVVAKVDYQTAP